MHPFRPLVILCAAVIAACGEPNSPEPSGITETAPANEVTGRAGDHVSFFVIGKSGNYRQDAVGQITLIDVGYFAEIFKLAGGGDVVGAEMQRVADGSEPIAFNREGDDGAVLFGHDGTRYQHIGEVDDVLPNGDYAFRFDTPGGRVDDFRVTLADDGGATELPTPPTIALEQAGEVVMPTAVDPGKDLRVAWTPFASGRADPNGIADDLIFVMMDDCTGHRAFHSGRPLATPNPLEPDAPSKTLLTFADDEVTIPADALSEGMRYLLKVEHARLLDTDRQQGVVGMSTFAVTTYLDVATRGDIDGGVCPGGD